MLRVTSSPNNPTNVSTVKHCTSGPIPKIELTTLDMEEVEKVLEEEAKEAQPLAKRSAILAATVKPKPKSNPAPTIAANTSQPSPETANKKW